MPTAEPMPSLDSDICWQQACDARSSLGRFLPGHVSFGLLSIVMELEVPLVSLKRTVRYLSINHILVQLSLFSLALVSVGWLNANGLLFRMQGFCEQ